MPDRGHSPHDPTAGGDPDETLERPPSAGAARGAQGSDADMPSSEAAPGEAAPDAAPGDDAGADGANHDVEALLAEVAGLRERLARARADYDNLQRRVTRDAALERERVKARVLEGFLEVYEYGKMAEFEALRNPGPLAEGVRMVVGAFDRMLANEGVQTTGQVGEAFDASRHEAVAHEAADGVAAGHVSRVVAPGYLLGDRVLRYAKVAVAPDGLDGGNEPASA